MNNTFAIDLGTNNIKIYNAATDKIMVQKNMIAIENKKNMIAFGDSAYEMYEKSPANIRVSGPITNGVIADINNMERLIKSFITYENKGAVRAADYFIAVPTDVTEVERRAFYDLLKDAGIKAKKILAVEKAVADGLGMGIDVKNSQGVLVVDVGYDTTEISILSLGGIVLSKLIKVGGHVFDTSIVNAVRREYNLVIGSKTAEGVRISFDDISKNEGKATVYGRDIVTGLPVERTLTHEFVSQSLQENFHTIVDNIKVILERTPPELAADIMKSGIHLTGDGARLFALDRFISESLGIPVLLARDPGDCCILGIGYLTENIQLVTPQDKRSRPTLK